MCQVLTGRYTPKIDMFSFGVLVVQMCTGLYPSIDDRVVHIGACVDRPCVAVYLGHAMRKHCPPTPLPLPLPLPSPSRPPHALTLSRTPPAFLPRAPHREADGCGSCRQTAMALSCGAVSCIFVCHGPAEIACKKFPVLSHLITSCVSMDPDYRLSAARALQRCAGPAVCSPARFPRPRTHASRVCVPPPTPTRVRRRSL